MRSVMPMPAGISLKDQRDKAKGTIAHEALERIAGIYHMDNQLSELSEEERYRKRQLLVRPLVEALFAWLKKVRDEKMVPEGGKTMKGVNYYLNHEKQFLEFLNHGNVPLDNNATESALRNFCMHKHTWRLIDTINGAKASALVYSIVETAKANGLNPFRYLEFLLTEMMEHEEDIMDSLMTCYHGLSLYLISVKYKVKNKNGH